MNLLKVYVEGRLLDLPKKIAIPYTISNPIFNNEQIEAPFTLTFDVDRTSVNEKIFKYPGRINQTTRQWEYDCRILFSAYNISSGTIVLQDVKEKELSLYFKAHNLDDNLGFSMKKLELTSFDLVSEYAAESKLIEIFNSNQNVFAPGTIKHTDFDESSIDIYYVPKTRSGGEVYPYYNNTFKIPYRYINQYSKISPLPCPYVHEVVRGILTHTGITNNPFTAEHLKRLFVQGVSNHFEIESYVSLFPGYKMRLEQFLPNYPCIDFLKELMKMYSLSVSYDQHGKGQIKHNIDLVNDGDPIDITSRVVDEEIISRQEVSDNQKQYTFSYDNEQSFDTSRVSYTVRKELDVFNVEINEDVEDAIGDKVYIRVKESGNVYVRYRRLKRNIITSGGTSSRVRQYWNGEWVLSHHEYYCVGRNWNNPTEGNMLKSALSPALTWGYKHSQSSMLNLYPWKKEESDTPRLNYYRGKHVTHGHVSCPFDFDGQVTIDYGGNQNTGGYELQDTGIVVIPEHKEELSPRYIHTRYHYVFSWWKGKEKLSLKVKLLLDGSLISKLKNTQHFFYKHKIFILKELKYSLHSDRISIGELEMVEK